MHADTNYAKLLVTKKSVINMGIKIHNNLPLEIKRIENVKVFKNKLKSYLLQNCFHSLQELLVTMMGGSLVTRVSLDMIRKCIDGLWTVIFTKHVMICFTWLTCVFGDLSIFIFLY
jgi:hypothetical protein